MIRRADLVVVALILLVVGGLVVSAVVSGQGTGHDEVFFLAFSPSRGSNA
jgi:hypothetical protein